MSVEKRGRVKKDKCQAWPLWWLVVLLTGILKYSFVVQAPFM
jgi:hypothetical protein